MDELSLYYGSHTGGEIDSAVSKVLDWDSAGIPDVASPNITGTTNDTGATIAEGTYFYLNGSLVMAKTDIANGAPFTESTNYEIVTAGGLNSIVSALPKFIIKSTSGSTTYTVNVGNRRNVLIYKFSSSSYVSATVSDGTDTVSIPSGSQSNFFRIVALSSTITVTVSDQFSGNPLRLMFMCC